jgi:hypothetical protein
MKRLVLVLGTWVVACAAPPPQAPAVAIPSPDPGDGAQAEDALHGERAILATLLALNRALLTNHDVDGYIAGWHTDGRWVAGRHARSSEYDVELDTEQLAAVRRLFIEGEPSRDVRYEGERVEIYDARAIVSWTLRSSFDTVVDLFAERYELAFHAGRWKVVALRYWPTGRIEDGEKFEFDAGWADALDRQIDTLIATGGDEAQLTYALFSAYRYREAHVVARRITEAEAENAWAWQMRMLSAGLAGDVADATFSQGQLRALE